MSENAKKKCQRACRRKRKGLEDKNAAKEGEMHVSGGFDANEPGPSKRPSSEKLRHYL